MRYLLVIGRWPAMGYVALESLRMRSTRFTGSVKMVAVRMQFTLYLVLLLNIYNSFVSALYFHIGETEKKCFIEEIPDETMIIGKYEKQNKPTL